VSCTFGTWHRLNDTHILERGYQKLGFTLAASQIHIDSEVPFTYYSSPLKKKCKPVRFCAISPFPKEKGCADSLSTEPAYGMFASTRLVKAIAPFRRKKGLDSCSWGG